MLAAMPPPATSSPAPSGAPSHRGRGDACPGALRLHRADDGALARIRVPGGLLTAAQADALGAAANGLGDGEVHLTSRGNVQLRGLGPECGGELAERLGAAGLLPSARHERVRNIVASPLSGLDGHGARDVGTWLSGLDALLCADDGAAGLSGRFLFVLDDGRGDVDALGGDVSLLARDDTSALLRVGAAETVLRVPGALAPRAALVAAAAFLERASDTGAWRVSDLPSGGDGLLDLVAERLREAGVDVAAAEHRSRPGRCDGPGSGIVTGPSSGSATLSAGLPLGRATSAQWRALVDTARHEGRGELRLTPWRGVVVPGVEPGRAAKALDALGAAGLVVSPDSPWTGVGACIGRPGCARSLADVRADAAAAVGAAGPLPVYWSGCERRCGHPRGTWVDVVATPGGHLVHVVRDGERAEPVPAADGPDGLAAAVAAARRDHG
ncbi:precorrin-3B synthase [Streptomyces sp. NPDC056347]|uniref:precorrin-3B synthase n=1 Tax=Streptomyces sp. NPDC056347 TaxID=3345790 RepID=UPI0035DD6191